MSAIYISYRHLVHMDACSDREDFAARFGYKPVLVTVTTAVANAHRFNSSRWSWLAQASLNADLFGELERRMHVAYRDQPPACFCQECNADGAKQRFFARCWAEAFLEQGGMEGRRR